MHIYEEKDPKTNEDVTEGAKVKMKEVTNRVRRQPETTKRRPKKEWRGNFRNCIRTERQYKIKIKKTNGVKKIKPSQRIVEVKRIRGFWGLIAFMQLIRTG
ncbi:hypothetical protein ERO13_A12G057250v2 [Gossypium hirsutum]|uniref:Uncharacterized protein n=3 Tax=Gossypium TaxID=3633 RepID=A0A5D2WQC4_GOSMU|nr:hypothetical protein ES319_A12G058800v1 [Gossypium barbadense]KAG4168972.1 hypothetical protein ERO13_A12G057250v2 [Gossypium hirsutum]TYG88960.1 hypothetical protein ES288_A12G062700v1 [Gossypium darwinii]TYJ03944.1 hypothetical protein E1A91_A12G061000v1 [Gossypium mustelinum]TYJ03945.1 hypothetical protein E1A91_A12G061000v1 [Gossypium mustelinum]